MTARPPKRPGARAWVGLGLAIAGALGLAGLLVILYGDSEVCEVLALRLGIAGALLLSSLAQAAVLIGGWLLWAGLRGPRGQRR